MVTVKKITPEKYGEVLELCQESFADVMEPEYLQEYLDSIVDWHISIMAIINDKVVGCYLFNEESINKFFKQGFYMKSLIDDIDKYQNLRGIQGVALVVSPDYRGFGIGKKLREFPKSMDFDYIWGVQLKSLENISDWLKYGRRLIAETPNEFITLMDLK